MIDLDKVEPAVQEAQQGYLQIFFVSFRNSLFCFFSSG
jgi:hypothetical protein